MQVNGGGRVWYNAAMAQPESLYGLLFPSDPQVSPDGQRAAFVLTDVHDTGTKERPAMRYRARLHLADGHGTRPLTFGDTDRAPRWSPDGTTLAFLRGQPAQLHLLPLAGGEAEKVTDLPGSVGDAQWSPDGEHLAFLSGAGRDEHADDEARVAERLSYRFNGLGWRTDVCRAVHVLNVRTREVRTLHMPPFEVRDFAWWPDGRGLLLATASDEAQDARGHADLVTVTLDGTPGETVAWGGSVGALAPHADGRILLLGRPGERGFVTDPHLHLYEDGAWRAVDAHTDRPAGNLVGGDSHVGAMPGRPAWLDAHTVAFLQTRGGACGVAQLDVRSGAITDRVFHAERVVAGFTANANGIAHLDESASDFPEVVLNGQRVTQNAARLGDLSPVAPARVTFGTDLGEGEGWVLSSGNGPQPALLSIHGGPHTAYGHAFMHEFQVFAARGYAVCYSNPRGSVGYGQAFVDDHHGRWGTVDAADLLAFFDACLARFPHLDRARTGVMGGSYGGFMTNWLTSQTDRFHVAVTDRCISNLISFQGTSDIGPWFWQAELGLDAHTAADVDRLWQMSPLKHAGNVRTPTLIIHAEEDHRCPVEQGEQWFTALKARGVPVRFVRFPGEDHELSRSGRPDRRVRRLHEYLRWLHTYVPAGADAEPVGA